MARAWGVSPLDVAALPGSVYVAMFQQLAREQAQREREG